MSAQAYAAHVKYITLMTPPVTFGALILMARKQKGLSQVVVSELLGYKYNLVHSWERNLRKPTAADWDDLKQLLSPELDIAAAEPLYEQWGLL